MTLEELWRAIKFEGHETIIDQYRGDPDANRQRRRHTPLHSLPGGRPCRGLFSGPRKLSRIKGHPDGEPNDM